MKIKNIVILFIFAATVGFKSQNHSAFQVGEQFVFKINYEFINAGYATLEVKEAIINNNNVSRFQRTQLYCLLQLVVLVLIPF